MTLTLPDGTRHPVPQAGLSIGRESGNDLLLTDPLVSRRHAHISYRDGTLYISDLGSHNGTLVNGDLITAERALHDGDMLELGNTKIWVHAQAAPPSMILPAAALNVPPPVEPQTAIISLADPHLERTVESVDEDPAARLVITASALQSRPDGAAAQVALRGVLDIETVDQFREATRLLLDNGVVHINLDLAQLEYVDSSGLGALVALFREVRPRSGSVVLGHVQPAVRRVIEVTRLDRVFTVA